MAVRVPLKDSIRVLGLGLGCGVQGGVRDFAMH